MKAKKDKPHPAVEAGKIMKQLNQPNKHVWDGVLEKKNTNFDDWEVTELKHWEFRASRVVKSPGDPSDTPDGIKTKYEMVITGQAEQMKAELTMSGFESWWEDADTRTSRGGITLVMQGEREIKELLEFLSEVKKHV